MCCFLFAEEDHDPDLSGDTSDSDLCHIRWYLCMSGDDDDDENDDTTTNSNNNHRHRHRRRRHPRHHRLCCRLCGYVVVIIIGYYHPSSSKFLSQPKGRFRAESSGGDFFLASPPASLFLGFLFVVGGGRWMWIQFERSDRRGLQRCGRRHRSGAETPGLWARTLMHYVLVKTSTYCARLQASFVWFFIIFLCSDFLSRYYDKM